MMIISENNTHILNYKQYNFQSYIFCFLWRLVESEPLRSLFGDCVSDALISSCGHGAFYIDLMVKVNIYMTTI